MKNKATSKLCGLVMPISPIDGCSAEHWSDIRNILEDAISNIEEYDFEVKIVSDSDDAGVIQKRIIQNLYDSDIVVCDVSGKNPNVMFELGIRLAFDKPTIIIKDDHTDYSFDIGMIEHLEYPRDLRFQKIIAFKELLQKKILATLGDYEKNPEENSFLNSFGTFKIAKLKEKELTSSDELIIDMLNEMQNSIKNIAKSSRVPTRRILGPSISNIGKKEEFMIIKNIEDVVSNFIKENPEFISEPEALMANGELENLIEKRVSIQSLFDTQRDYHRFLKTTIQNFINNNT